MLKKAVVVGVALVAPVQAASVYDANGQLVGELVGFEQTMWAENPDNVRGLPNELDTVAWSGVVIMRLPPYGKQMVKVSLLQGFVAEPVDFYFIPPGCRSEGALDFLPYNPYFDLLPHARFDGTTMWAVDAHAWGNLSPKSLFTETNGIGSCKDLPEGSTAFVAPAHAVTVHFSPPFSVR
jgi:hypothetical protein